MSYTFKLQLLCSDESDALPMQENLVFTNLAKNQRDVEAAGDVFRNARQTILCSATIPQRWIFIHVLYANSFFLQHYRFFIV